MVDDEPILRLLGRMEGTLAEISRGQERNRTEQAQENSRLHSRISEMSKTFSQQMAASSERSDIRISEIHERIDETKKEISAIQISAAKSEGGESRESKMKSTLMTLFGSTAGAAILLALWEGFKSLSRGN